MGACLLPHPLGSWGRSMVNSRPACKNCYSLATNESKWKIDSKNSLSENVSKKAKSRCQGWEVVFLYSFLFIPLDASTLPSSYLQHWYEHRGSPVTGVIILDWVFSWPLESCCFCILPWRSHTAVEFKCPVLNSLPKPNMRYPKQRQWSHWVSQPGWDDGGVPLTETNPKSWNWTENKNSA